MADKNELRNQLFELRFALAMTKDISEKEVINKKIEEVKKSYSSILLEEASNKIKRGR